MKTKFFLLALFGIALWSCEKEVDPRTLQNNNWGSTFNNGKLCYMANPFSPDTDTLLCINNMYLYFENRDSAYCSYVRDLLSQFGGWVTECKWHKSDSHCHEWEHMSEPDACFYPICSKQLVSVIDPKTGKIADAITINDRTIYPKQRRKNDSNHTTRFYLGDFVSFMSSNNDYKYITDSVTVSGDTIVFFDGNFGPFSGDPSLVNTHTPIDAE